MQHSRAKSLSRETLGTMRSRHLQEAPNPCHLDRTNFGALALFETPDVAVRPPLVAFAMTGFEVVEPFYPQLAHGPSMKRLEHRIEREGAGCSCPRNSGVITDGSSIMSRTTEELFPGGPRNSIASARVRARRCRIVWEMSPLRCSFFRGLTLDDMA